MCLLLVLLMLLMLFCLVSDNWQEPGISKAYDLTVARFAKEKNGYGEVQFPNIIWPFYWLQKVEWGGITSDSPYRLLALSQGISMVILSLWVSLAFHHQLQPCCRISAYRKDVFKNGYRFALYRFFFHNTVVIRKIIIIHPLRNETGKEHNRDDKMSLLMVTAMIFEHWY